MQPPVTDIRSDLTQQQVVDLIQESPSLTVTAGADLLDQSLNVILDLSDDVVSGSVSRSSYADLHGECSLLLTRELSWQTAIVRPHITLDDGSTSATFRLGAYYTNMPETATGWVPQDYAVTGVDILHVLHDLVGDSYGVPAGTRYLAAVETILQRSGVTAYRIDQAAASKTLPSDQTWAIDDNLRWINVVNDLLAAIGYAGIYSDWDGRLRCEPYVRPLERAVEWVYDATSNVTLLGASMTVTRDYFEAPNRWVAIRNNNVAGTQPVEGNGRYTYVNQSAGLSSVDARGGRTVTRILRIDAADQPALMQTAYRSIDADMALATKLQVTTAPNPLHWHFDRIAVADPALGPLSGGLVSKWTMPLDGGDMSHEVTVL